MTKLILIICFIPLLLATAEANTNLHTDLLETIKQMIIVDLNKRTNNEVELTSIKVIKGLEIFNSNEPKRVKGINFDKQAGKNRVYYTALIEDKKEGFNYIIVDAVFDTSIEIYMTARNIQRGTVMKNSDFYVVKHKNSKIPTGAITDKKLIEGRVATNNLAQGIVIRDSHLTDTLVIKRGQRVDIILHSGGVVLSAQGILKGDAPLGGTARVYCEATKKELTGIMESNNTVHVQLH
ncbi:MAG: flagellar basal body P-ring formation chaperone FlgA [Thermodesulfovibrionales bacterium]|nr:flagellar basal body P-ring formation chaperone FlgA [Thermodesulfovibrionales bacterium]